MTKGTALADLVNEMKIGWSVLYDMNDVEKTIRYLLSNPKLLKRAGHLGNKIFLRKYTWDVMEDVLVKNVYA